MLNQERGHHLRCFTQRPSTPREVFFCSLEMHSVTPDQVTIKLILLRNHQAPFHIDLAMMGQAGKSTFEAIIPLVTGNFDSIIDF